MGQSTVRAKLRRLSSVVWVCHRHQHFRLAAPQDVADTADNDIRTRPDGLY
jgi:hypothetical protein